MIIYDGSLVLKIKGESDYTELENGLVDYKSSARWKAHKLETS